MDNWTFFYEILYGQLDMVTIRYSSTLCQPPASSTLSSLEALFKLCFLRSVHITHFIIIIVIFFIITTIANVIIIIIFIILILVNISPFAEPSLHRQQLV